MCCLHVKSSCRFNFHPFKNPLLCKLNNLCSPMPRVMSFTIVQYNCNNPSLPVHFSLVFVAPPLSLLALPNPHKCCFESSFLIPWRCLFHSGYLWKNICFSDWDFTALAFGESNVVKLVVLCYSSHMHSFNHLLTHHLLMECCAQHWGYSGNQDRESVHCVRKSSWVILA